MCAMSARFQVCERRASDKINSLRDVSIKASRKRRPTRARVHTHILPWPAHLSAATVHKPQNLARQNAKQHARLAPSQLAKSIGSFFEKLSGLRAGSLGRLRNEITKRARAWPAESERNMFAARQRGTGTGLTSTLWYGNQISGLSQTVFLLLLLLPIRLLLGWPKFKILPTKSLMNFVNDLHLMRDDHLATNLVLRPLARPHLLSALVSDAALLPAASGLAARVSSRRRKRNGLGQSE